MSTTASPFDPHAFPDDLVAAQRRAAELHVALHRLQARLPWSREPHKGWPEQTERGKEHPGRPATEGWPAEDAVEFDRLLEDLRETTGIVQSHEWWGICDREGVKGAALVAARMALKRAPGAVPDEDVPALAPEDVQQAA
ncbi:hypothetical protein [Streptomyces hirsutus]|uniref:hypothetical protein n=1 Tax=Streptomyces hirsutus TaxID=35620 RepID=UPI003327F40E